MKIEDGKLILTTHECRRCDADGLTEEILKEDCEKCNGTGRGPRGGRRGCKKCYGSGNQYRPSGRMVACSRCDGTKSLADTYYDDLPMDLWAGLTFKVYRNPRRRQTWAEAHFGVGCWSLVDYGRHQSQTDEQIIEEVTTGRHNAPQACKILRSHYDGRTIYDPTMPDHIGVFTSDNGYFVAAVHVDGEDKTIQTGLGGKGL